jgi:hypothetical protein
LAPPQPETRQPPQEPELSFRSSCSPSHAKISRLRRAAANSSGATQIKG